MAQQLVENLMQGLEFRTRLNENFTELYSKANHCLGYYDTMELLEAAHPTGEAGDWAIVGNPSDPAKPYFAVWDVDTSSWVVSGASVFVTSVFGRTGAVVAGNNDYAFSQISGNLAAHQLPASGNWALTGNLVINSGSADADFTINSQTGVAYAYDAGANTHLFNAESNKRLLYLQRVGTIGIGYLGEAAETNYFIMGGATGYESGLMFSPSSGWKMIVQSGAIQHVEFYTNTILKMFTTFNVEHYDQDFTINKNYSGVAYAYDAGDDTHSFNSTMIIEATKYVYLGPVDTDGSWRFGRSGDDMVFERRESGVWVKKGAFTAV